MNPVKSYLTLSDFRWKLIGLRWSSVENSLEYSRGVFAFAEEIAEFLEGFAGIRRIVHFGYIVRLLLLLRRAPDDSDVADSGRRRLWQLFTDTKGTLRNAGAFCGRLCRDIPAARAANHVADMCRRLRGREGRERVPRWAAGRLERPPAAPGETVATGRRRPWERTGR